MPPPLSRHPPFYPGLAGTGAVPCPCTRAHAQSFLIRVMFNCLLGVPQSRALVSQSHVRWATSGSTRHMHGRDATARPSALLLISIGDGRCPRAGLFKNFDVSPFCFPTVSVSECSARVQVVGEDFIDRTPRCPSQSWAGPPWPPSMAALLVPTTRRLESSTPSPSLYDSTGWISPPSLLASVFSQRVHASVLQKFPLRGNMHLGSKGPEPLAL